MRSSKLWQSQTFSELIGDGGTTYYSLAFHWEKKKLNKFKLKDHNLLSSTKWTFKSCHDAFCTLNVSFSLLQSLLFVVLLLNGS